MRSCKKCMGYFAKALWRNTEGLGPHKEHSGNQIWRWSSPGADRMTGAFFHRYWEIIGDQVTKEVQELFANDSFPVDWNFTLLRLLPKTVNPTAMTDLRRISLCLVLYKIISKILVARLKQMLADLVSPSHSEFVKRDWFLTIPCSLWILHALRTDDKW